jgi:hypothetical protein
MPHRAREFVRRAHATASAELVEGMKSSGVTRPPVASRMRAICLWRGNRFPRRHLFTACAEQPRILASSSSLSDRSSMNEASCMSPTMGCFYGRVKAKMGDDRRAQLSQSC